jgi:hypothetical protein
VDRGLVIKVHRDLEELESRNKYLSITASANNLTFSFSCTYSLLQLRIAMGSDTPLHSPHEMLNFSISRSSAAVLSPRLGRLTIAGRKPILTPHYIPLTSRGVVPHLAHDVMRDNTSIGSLYIGLEDCTCPEIEERRSEAY